MAEFTTDFSEYSTGSAPSDWTSRYGTFGTNEVQTNSDADKISSNKYTLNGPAYARSLSSWDDVDNEANIDMLTKFVVPTTVDAYHLYIYGRASGGTTTTTAYALRLGTENNGNISIHKWSSGSGTAIDSEHFDIQEGYSYFVRFRINGTDLKAKIWRAYQPEPEHWTLEATDSSISSGGWNGLGTYTGSNDVEIDYFAVATDGDEPTFPPSGWTWADADKYFGSMHPVPGSNYQDSNQVTAMAGSFGSGDRWITGARIYIWTLHNEQVRVAAYSGGSLTTGPVGATLLVDFGKTTGSDTSTFYEFTCDPVKIPTNQPLWIAVKGNSSGTWLHESDDHSYHGNFQPDRGEWETTSIDYDEDNAWDATWPTDSGGAFSTTRWLIGMQLETTTDAPGLPVSVVDTVSVAESVSLNLPQPDVHISVYDTVSVNEAVSLGGVISVSVEEDVAVSDELTAYVEPAPEFQPFIIEGVTVSDVPSGQVPFLSVVVSDDISVVDTPTVMPKLHIRVVEEIAYVDQVGVNTVLNVQVDDEATLTESVDYEFSEPIPLSVYDSVSISEDTTRYGTLNTCVPYYDVILGYQVTVPHDHIEIQDVPVLSIFSSCSIYEQVLVEEQVTVYVASPARLTLNVSDNISVDDAIERAMSDLEISKGEDIAVAEEILRHGVLHFSVHDTISMFEYTTEANPLLLRSLFDSVSVEEHVSGIVGAVKAQAHDCIDVDDSSDTFLMESVGRLKAEIDLIVPETDITVIIPER